MIPQSGDGHGSTRMLVDALGQPILNGSTPQIFAYDAYGNPIGFDPTLALTTLLYNAEQLDKLTGLQYLRARYFNPASGRFNRLDPWNGDPASPISLHKYLYANAEPVNTVDPSGFTGEPLQLRKGKAAHKIITEYYKLDHPAHWVVGGTKPWRGLRRLLPDIVNFRQKTIGEIKSVGIGQAAIGAAQLAGYLSLANMATMGGCGTWSPDSWIPTPAHSVFWLGAVDATLADCYGVVFPSVLGVITYKLIEVPQNQPPPVPFPLPEPVPVIEFETKRALEAVKRAFTFEDGLIADHLAEAAYFTLFGMSAVLAGMMTVDAVNAARGGPQLYRGTTGGFGGGFNFGVSF